MHLLIVVLIGLATGWLAGPLMKGRGYGLSGNLILSLIGSIVGGGSVLLLGFAAPGDMLRVGLAAWVGAAVVLAAARQLRPAPRQATAPREEGTIAEVEEQFRRLGQLERRVLEHLHGHRAKRRDPNESFEEQMTFGQRVADRMAAFGGSWPFIGLFLFIMLLWITLNASVRKPFDPFPFILLNLVLSCLAALQAPVIMMSQNRQAQKDRLIATHDYEVNLRTELDLAKLHARFDELRDEQWAKLVEMQARQIEMLERLLREREVPGGPPAA